MLRWPPSAFSEALALNTRRQKSGRWLQPWSFWVVEARDWEAGFCHCYSTAVTNLQQGPLGCLLRWVQWPFRCQLGRHSDKAQSFRKRRKKRLKGVMVSAPRLPPPGSQGIADRLLPLLSS